MKCRNCVHGGRLLKWLTVTLEILTCMIPSPRLWADPSDPLLMSRIQQKVMGCYFCDYVIRNCDFCLARTLSGPLTCLL